jgi:hypothetical protein
MLSKSKIKFCLNSSIPERLGLILRKALLSALRGVIKVEFIKKVDLGLGFSNLF